MKTFWLSFHASYRCRDAGVCCSSGWDIPLETTRVSAIEWEIVAQHVSAPAHWLRRVPDMPAEVGGVLARQDDGHCVFHHASACTIHGVIGHDALPSACQHFPRICLIDPRGVFVTLSHYCPTAASMLFDDLAAVAKIVEGPAALPSREIPEGLDARDALPPLLTTQILMDHESYGAWESRMVRVCTSGFDPDAALALLEADAKTLSAWRPGSSSLLEAIAALPEPAQAAPAATIDWHRDRQLFALVRDAVVTATKWPDAPDDAADIWSRLVADQWGSFRPVLNNYLAAHAFASWMAYQGNGIESIVRSLRAALATLRIETARACEQQNLRLTRDTLAVGIRHADLLLRHLVDRGHLAQALITSRIRQ